MGRTWIFFRLQLTRIEFKHTSFVIVVTLKKDTLFNKLQFSFNNIYWRDVIEDLTREKIILPPSLSLLLLWLLLPWLLLLLLNIFFAFLLCCLFSRNHFTLQKYCKYYIVITDWIKTEILVENLARLSFIAEVASASVDSSFLLSLILFQIPLTTSAGVLHGEER